MSISRGAIRAFRPLANVNARMLSTSARRMKNENPGSAQEHDNVSTYRQIQKEKELNPHLTNSNSTLQHGMPKAGKANAQPDVLSSVDPKFIPRDSVAENTDRMLGGTQNPLDQTGNERGDGRLGGVKRAVQQKEREWNKRQASVPKIPGDMPAEGREAVGLGEVAEGGEGYKGGGSYVTHTGELQVGELEGGSFKIEPLVREGEDAATMRARLLYQSRKRGTLESDLLMSTFADAHLKDMSIEQMREYSLFLDENDWDIYYWATQEPQELEFEYEAATAGETPGAYVGTQGDASKPVAPASGEWAQTIGTFKPLYRPVPARWRGSEILKRLREHVLSRSAGGVVDCAAEGSRQGGGMAFMPAVKNFDGK